MLWSQHSKRLIFFIGTTGICTIFDHKMERAHQLVAEGTLDAEDNHFWIKHWPHIASAKVSLETKITAYRALRLRGIASPDSLSVITLYEMVLADRVFVAELDKEPCLVHSYRLLIMWIDDDVVALTAYCQTLPQDRASLQNHLNLTNERLEAVNQSLRHALLQINAPRCMRFLFRDKGFREAMTKENMTPLVLRLVEELVQPTDQLNRESLLTYGQSVKLIGMRVQDEELVAAWLFKLQRFPLLSNRYMSVMFARKLHALATPDQRVTLKGNVMWEIYDGRPNEACLELAWLFDQLGPFNPTVQKCFLKHNKSVFPAFTFAMIVALCDGYLALARKITTPQRRFFTLVARLPMDVQTLVSLRLWEHASIVIQREKFDRALLAVL
jgi:hypothetical protein